MAEESKTGLGAALTQAMAAAEPPAAPVQLPLMPADQLDQVSQGADRTSQLRAPRPGRPPGSTNRKTQAMAAWLLSRYQSPLQGLAEAYSRPVQDLAAELGCTPLEAFRLQMQAMVELAPYLHGKMPVAVDLGGALPVLHLVPAEAAARAFQQGADGRMAFDLSQLQPIQGNQGVIDVPASEVERPELNGQPEGEADQAVKPQNPLTGDQQA
jgi:hypothetical protein